MQNVTSEHFTFLRMMGGWGVCTQISLSWPPNALPMPLLHKHPAKKFLEINELIPQSERDPSKSNAIPQAANSIQDWTIIYGSVVLVLGVKLKS